MTIFRRGYLCVWLLMGIVPLGAQTPSEHESHHPQEPAKQSAGTKGTASKSGMSGEMEGMMKQMLNPPPKELYPTLMSLPELSPAKRAQIEREAHSRMVAGTRLMSQGLTRMPPLVERKDYPSLQKATEQVRQGLAQFESGLAAHRAINEGKAPSAVALEWFRTEMNLPSPVDTTNKTGESSVPPWFHPAAMVLLSAFAAAMIGMYFFKMHRASVLLAGLRVQPQPSTAVAAPLSPAPKPTEPSLPGTGWSGTLRVARIFQETPDVKTFRLAAAREDGFPFSFEPGQFLTVGVPVGGKTVKRSYSIASSPCCHGWCDITVKNTSGGVVSSYLHTQIKEGDQLDVSGPWGRFTFRGQEAPNVVFIAGGVGITPLMSSIRYLTDQSWPGRIDLLYACSSMTNIIFKEELDYLRRHPNLHVSIILSKEESSTWTGKRGYITRELLMETVPDLPQRRIHLCGPPPMMESVKADLDALGVPAAQVHTELFIAPQETPQREVTGAATAKTYSCAFHKSNKSAIAKPGHTILETAEDNGITIDYSCRQGYCGVCKVRLLEGSVSMAIQDGLSSRDRASQIILACQAIPKTDVKVDA